MDFCGIDRRESPRFVHPQRFCARFSNFDGSYRGVLPDERILPSGMCAWRTMERPCVWNCMACCTTNYLPTRCWICGFFAMKKVLVTGASGFIGRHCLPLLLERGFEVHALSQKPLPGPGNDVIWHSQNFLDDNKTQRLIENVQPSHCLHFAWYTEPGKYWSSPENLRWIASSALLLYSFNQNGGERFVGAGTCAEYDWRYGHCTEMLTP